MLITFVSALFCLSGIESKAAVSCKTDCNKRCPEKFIGGEVGKIIKKIGPKISIGRDPVCKSNCELAKALIACPLKVKVPVPGGPMEEFVKAVNQNCSAAFQLFTKAVSIGVCPIGAPAADSERIRQIKSDLLAAKVLNAADFENVTIRFCRITAGGLAADRNQIILNESLRKASDIELASVLAHEMKHIQQYRRAKSTDEFKCAYTRQYVTAAFARTVTMRSSTRPTLSKTPQGKSSQSSMKTKDCNMMRNLLLEFTASRWVVVNPVPDPPPSWWQATKSLASTIADGNSTYLSIRRGLSSAKALVVASSHHWVQFFGVMRHSGLRLANLTSCLAPGKEQMGQGVLELVTRRASIYEEMDLLLFETIAGRNLPLA
jgi:hypothetical protein